MKIILGLASFFLLLGCVTGELMSSLSPGMPKDEVIRVLGKPDGYQTSESGYESLKYSNRLTSGWSWDRADYFVILKDQKVVEYGAGEVRSKNNNVLFLYRLN